MEDEEGTAARVKLAAELLSLLYAIWLIWLLIPEHRRKLMIMRGMEGTRRLAALLASRTGAAAISLEARTGTENYLLPYGLSLMRDACGRAYEKVRYS